MKFKPFSFSLNLRGKLIGSFSLILIIALYAEEELYLQLRHISMPLKKQLPVEIERLRNALRAGSHIGNIKLHYTNMNHNIQNYVLTKGIQWKQKYFVSEDHIEKSINGIMPNLDMEEEKKLREIISHVEKVIVLNQKAMNNLENGKEYAALRLMKNKRFILDKESLRKRINSFQIKHDVHSQHAMEASIINFIRIYEDTNLLLNNSISFISTSIGVIITIFFLITVYMNHSIIKPVQMLTRAAQSVKEGNLKTDFIAQAKGTDEISQLTNSFKNMTSSLKEARSNLESRVKERTQKLHEANVNLEMINEELLQFAYRTSHDLVAPLKTTKGYLNFIQEDIQEGNYREAGELISMSKKQIGKLENMIHDILTLCKADRLKDQYREIDFQKIIQNILFNNKTQIGENRILIRYQFNHKTHFISSAVRITQILENLVTNSIKYFDPEKKRHLVTITTETLPDGQLSLTVKDNGIGIPEKERKNIFNMFYRINQKNSYGSGLGLYITQKYITALKGDIRVFSKGSAKRGTKFMVTLPNYREEKVSA